MQVDVPGFKGGDHTSLDLPAEEELLKALDNPGEPFVAVLMKGSALSVNWGHRTPTRSSTHGTAGKRAEQRWLKP